ncbi:MAG: tRNA (N(6)-L-threonylcarbamoyladenosine(37)-C(2))-methylthiotransferase MtaB [Clostridiales bacterium]|nr:tRNA (N(6)-L-threonylcarbamoyladenosine(37)-C(2))-methylthiotransferase MtaB [Clostridiales bacterium]
MKVAFHTLGCKVNQYETEALAESFKKKGYEIAAEGEHADVHVINTCTVTGEADRKSRQCIRRIKRADPRSIVAVTGCYAQASPGEVGEIDGVDIVVGNKNKMGLPESVERFLAAGAPVCDSEPLDAAWGHGEAGDISAMEGRTRAYIKIQDGCNRFCSYCIVPYVRGGIRSRPAESVISEARRLIEGGYKEIVLAGINTALYGAEGGFPDGSLESIIGELDRLDGDFRIRLSSLEPTVIDADYVKKLFKYEKLCRHIHLSLQSGSDETLKRMNRRYSMGEYMEIVSALRGFDPDYGISTDMIAGFPGESEHDFNKSLEVLEKVDFCKVHVFRYSDRKGTAASEMCAHVSGDERNRRRALLLDGGERSARRFFERNIGQERRVLVEEYIEGKGMYAGYTENYIRAFIDASYASEVCAGSALNEFAQVRLSGLFMDGMEARAERREHETFI